MSEFKKPSHFNDGKVHMVSIKDKKIGHRTAISEGLLEANKNTIERLFNGDLPKGEALSVARVAGIQAAKQTALIIPLCHSLPIEYINIDITKLDSNTLKVVSEVSTSYRTGVEMEALTAVSASLLALWDMLKSVDKTLNIKSIKLLEKTKETH